MREAGERTGSRRPASAAPPAAPNGAPPQVLLLRQAGNRAIGRVLARAPAGDVKARPGSVPDARNGLSPQELWKLVETTRGLTSRVPPHAVRAAEERLQQAQHALAELREQLQQARDDPDLRKRGKSQATTDAKALRDRLAGRVAAAEREADRARRAARSARANASEAPPANPADVNRRQLGHGVRTYGAIQVTNAQGRRVAVAVGAFTFDGSLHAEEQALAKIRADLARRGLKPGVKPGADWTVTVVVDQEVCTGPCRPALRQFANDFGIKPGNVVAHYPAQEGRDVSPKGASKTAHLHPTTVPTGPGHRVLVETPPAPRRPPVVVDLPPLRLSVRGVANAVGGSLLLLFAGLWFSQYTERAIQELMARDVKRLEPLIDRQVKAKLDAAIAAGTDLTRPVPWAIYVTLDASRMGSYDGDLLDYYWGIPTVSLVHVVLTPGVFEEGEWDARDPYPKGTGWSGNYERIGLGTMVEHNYYSIKIPVKDLLVPAT